MEEKIRAVLRRNWEPLIGQGQSMQYRQGQVLCYEGHSPYGVFVLKSGTVRFTAEKQKCTEDHLGSAPQGKVIGLLHFFSNEPFCCTCTAVTDCELVFISKSQLLPFAAGDAISP